MKKKEILTFFSSGFFSGFFIGERKGNAFHVFYSFFPFVFSFIIIKTAQRALIAQSSVPPKKRRKKERESNVFIKSVPFSFSISGFYGKNQFQ